MANAGTINSDIVAAGQGTKSVYPGTVSPVYGSVTIPAGTSFATTDSLVLFSAPGPSSHIQSFWMDFPALVGTATFTLTDGTNTIATVTSTTVASGGFVDEAAVAAHGKIGNGVTYTTATTIKLVPLTASTATSGASATVIYFGFGVVND